MTMLNSLNLDAELAVAGPTAASFSRLWQKVWQSPYLPAELIDLCRLTLARLHADAADLEATNPAVAGSALPNPALHAQRRQAVLAGRAHTDPVFSAAEKAVLEFAEIYGIDAQSLTDEIAGRVKAHYGEPGLVFLIEARPTPGQGARLQPGQIVDVSTSGKRR